MEPRRLLAGPSSAPAMPDEHTAIMALVADAAVTDTAVNSGNWSDPATWQSLAPPAAGANVLVPAGLAVTVDAVNVAPLHTVRVDGTLDFATASDTQLAVDTIVVTPDGTLRIGTAADPVRDGATARVVFTDAGPIDTTWDPLLFSRGLVAQGSTSVYGAAKTPFATLAGPAAKGSSVLVFAEAPQNWKSGDEIVLPGTAVSENQDERLTITGVAGRFVHVDHPLAWAHAAPRPDLQVYAANLTRNVVFASQEDATGAAPPPARRGHVMFFHTPRVDLNNAEFDHLGRTDKTRRINDPRLDDAGRLIPGTGTNARGRYAVHFHRTGVDPTVSPATVRGSVVDDGAGWGFVNHSSDVIFEGDVSHNVAGSGFVAEAGDEIGAFRHNFALRSAGSGQPTESRLDVQDFGHEGNGFWFQGPGVEVADNVAAGQRGSGFIYFTRGLQQDGTGATRFPTANLPDPSIAGGAESMAVGDVPLRLFRNNYAFASGDGFECWFNLLDATHAARSVVDGFTTWGNRSGVGAFLPYSRHLTLRNVRALGDLRTPAGVGVARNDVTGDVEILNPRVEGFAVGVGVPRRGDNVVHGGLLNNVQNVQVTDATEAGRSVRVGAVRFGRLAPAALAGRRQYDLFVKSAGLTPDSKDLARVFSDDMIRIDGREAFRPEQAAAFVPYPGGDPSTPAYVPPELIGRTNAQLWEAYGLAVSGAVASVAAAPPGRLRSNVALGAPVEHSPDAVLYSRKYTNRLQGYQLAYALGAGSATVRETVATDLRPGWNLLTRTIDGRPRTLFVFGDLTPPTILQARRLAINPLALARGFTVQEPVLDDSIGKTLVTKTFGDLPSRPVQTRPDGSQFLLLDFRTTDLAGNAATSLLELNLDPSAPM